MEPVQTIRAFSFRLSAGMAVIPPSPRTRWCSPKVGRRHWASCQSTWIKYKLLINLKKARYPSHTGPSERSLPPLQRQAPALNIRRLSAATVLDRHRCTGSQLQLFTSGSPCPPRPPSSRRMPRHRYPEAPEVFRWKNHQPAKSWGKPFGNWRVRRRSGSITSSIWSCIRRKSCGRSAKVAGRE